MGQRTKKTGNTTTFLDREGKKLFSIKPTSQGFVIIPHHERLTLNYKANGDGHENYTVGSNRYADIQKKATIYGE